MLAGYEKSYKGDKQRVERSMSRERFVVPENAILTIYIPNEMSQILAK